MLMPGWRGSVIPCARGRLDEALTDVGGSWVQWGER
jgi:hypothetical protein